MDINDTKIYSATQRAKCELISKNLTLSVTDGKTFYSSDKRGVRPLLDLYENATNVRGFCACDKVVGKGASFLYALLGIKQVYAITASYLAIDTLKGYGISVVCEKKVDRILNREKTGFCPIENAVIHENDAYKALEKIYTALEKLHEKEKVNDL